MKYVGLTDDPATRKQQHGNPIDWQQQMFASEKEARQWETDMISSGYKGGSGGSGWRYGYTYTITSGTIQ